ncbi:universal stress protein UspA [Intrasporangium chromatireducens Q5-1]|uniref:Universal stress protein UspA n=1 Tax=Intrasporangium chromatireducens Q5-1 TaxID=584657 RepID=W9GG25_9MICO|nr:universal stress protein [Intrasporangium chromatireducens]EWT05181.1 universal stress protein UspA [Intrasporangium chromatireducens Q5-1]
MTIVIGYIPTKQGEAALTAGLDEARAHGDSVLVVNMARDDKLVDAHRAPSQDLDRLERDLAESGIEHEVRRIEHGTDPAVALLELAEEVDARLLVIGLRHRTPVGKLLLGSTAQRILLDAPCPVLAVKPA